MYIKHVEQCDVFETASQDVRTKEPYSVRCAKGFVYVLHEHSYRNVNPNREMRHRRDIFHESDRVEVGHDERQSPYKDITRCGENPADKPPNLVGKSDVVT